MKRQQVNFAELVEQVQAPLVGSDHLSIWGGTCSENVLLDFLERWSLKQMAYRIWEYTDQIAFAEHLPDNTALLERGRLFGEGGDLGLRRDGDVFRWRFVGKPEVRPPDGYDTNEANFWTDHPDAAFHCYKETALLWGKRDGDHWHDDRVAAADLRYPVDGEQERVRIRYNVYSRAGQVAFVWFTGLSEWKEPVVHKQNITTEGVRNG